MQLSIHNQNKLVDTIDLALYKTFSKLSKKMRTYENSSTKFKVALQGQTSNILTWFKKSNMQKQSMKIIEIQLNKIYKLWPRRSRTRRWNWPRSSMRLTVQRMEQLPGILMLQDLALVNLNRTSSKFN